MPIFPCCNELKICPYHSVSSATATPVTSERNPSSPLCKIRTEIDGVAGFSNDAEYISLFNHSVLLLQQCAVHYSQVTEICTSGNLLSMDRTVWCKLQSVELQQKLTWITCKSVLKETFRTRH